MECRNIASSPNCTRVAARQCFSPRRKVTNSTVVKPSEKKY
jgi:hypothetical protein